MRKFNVTGICVPDMHYMVDISGKIEQIFRLMEEKAYFIIDKANEASNNSLFVRFLKMLRDKETRINQYITLNP